MKSLMNKKGFTLIELMIVIAIIGILAAVAIPNFISYRDKSYCSQAESNARTVASAIAEYYAVASRTAAIPRFTDLRLNNSRLSLVTSLSLGTSVNGVRPIVITITDPNGRCPEDYRKASERWSNTDFKYYYTMQ